MSWLAKIAAWICFGLVSGPASFGLAEEPASRPEATPGLAIVGVQVLPMVGSERLADQTVLIVDDRIKAVGPRGDFPAPSGFQVIDGAGMTLMPGLVDMHVHVANTPGSPGDAAQRALAVMMAHGVTTARSMAGGANHPELRSAVERGELVGPRLYLAAPALHDGNAPTVDEARQAVRSARAAGYDFIKSHHLTDPQVWAAVQDQAREEGMATAGHVTVAVGPGRAARSGQQIEHLDGLLHELLPIDHPLRGTELGQIPPSAAFAALGQVTAQDIDQIARRAVDDGAWHVPTLSLFEKATSAERPIEDRLTDPEMRFVPPQTLSQWRQQYEASPAMGLSPEEAAIFHDIRRRIVGAMARAEAPIMAGSDSAQAFHVWGAGLIEEIKALHAAGLSRMEALRAATVTPARYFQRLPNQGSSQGWPADFGIVAPGARADLILLGADPSEDLNALHDLRLVVRGGLIFDRPTLERLLTQAERDARRAAP